MSEVTQILKAIERGEPKAAAELLPVVYEELRKLAADKMAHELGPQTLQPTALVHEAWLRLTANDRQAWDSRAHFFGAAAEAMRRILIENARRKKAVRHGAGLARLDIQAIDLAAPVDDDRLLDINDALEKFAAQDPAKAELVKLRYFVGLSLEEAAAALNISEATAKRWWAYARAWLYSEIKAR
jgi:RNA polymerase sigma factor (TIGR02999 family)